jgi:hypothetical protein
VDCPSCGHSVPVGGDDKVMLTKAELLRIVADAVQDATRKRA